MGGQACVLYGAAEFSRDTDLAILADPKNLALLQKALDQLDAVRIAIPPFEAPFLERGHAVHFRCRHPDVHRLRVDVMAVMRGVAPFAELWERRTTFISEIGVEIDALALPDLVRAKKTQRDKDWPMIRRLVDVNYIQNRPAPTSEQLRFWLLELRTVALLREVAAAHPAVLELHQGDRPLLLLVQDGSSEDLIAAALHREEMDEREQDREYWKPLRAELEQLRWKERLNCVSVELT